MAGNVRSLAGELATGQGRLPKNSMNREEEEGQDDVRPGRDLVLKEGKMTDQLGKEINRK